MGRKKIYFLFTNTGTYLSRLINFVTRESLNHVSIGFDQNLTEVYSFGRKKPNNPFIGGFICEDIRKHFPKNSSCAVYVYELKETECQTIMDKINEIETKKDKYRYNFIGLIGVVFNIKLERKYAYFCSQFVANMLSETESFPLSKPHYFITPSDIRNQKGMKLIYQGCLENYKESLHHDKLPILEENKSVNKWLMKT